MHKTCCTRVVTEQIYSTNWPRKYTERVRRILTLHLMVSIMTGHKEGSSIQKRAQENAMLLHWIAVPLAGTINRISVPCHTVVVSCQFRRTVSIKIQIHGKTAVNQLKINFVCESPDAKKNLPQWISIESARKNAAIHSKIIIFAFNYGFFKNIFLCRPWNWQKNIVWMHGQPKQKK